MYKTGKLILILITISYFFLCRQSIEKPSNFDENLIDTIYTSNNILGARQVLKYVKDSIKASLEMNQCPIILGDPCLDYRREYRSYLQFTLDEKTNQRILGIGCYYKRFSLKEDLIDSLSIYDLTKICKICDSTKLNLKCSDSMYLGIIPNTCKNLSTYQLIEMRLNR